MEYAIDYFAAHSGLHRLIVDMHSLYARHNRVFGSVRISSPTLEEEQALSTFFERDYENQALIRISMGDFERQLAKTFGAEVNLEDFLRLSAYSPPMQKRFPPGNNKDIFADTIQHKLLPAFANTRASAWLMEVSLQNNRHYKPWIKQFETDPITVISHIGKAADLINHLPNQVTPLPHFATQYVCNPSGLDFHSALGALFSRALAYCFAAPIPRTVEDAIALYLQGGLLTQGVMCRVAVKGLITPDPICALYNNLNQSHVLTLEDMTRITHATAHHHRVYVLENALVFAMVLEQLPDTQATILSPMDIYNPAFTRLLEVLCQNPATRIYYAGNMDHKGLAQADKLYQKFGKQFIPWRYTKADYTMAIEKSGHFSTLEKKELAMHHEDLALILSQIRKKGKVGGILPLVPLLVSDIRKGGAS